MIIEFVSYDGKYPNLCSGTLTLRIDGQYVKFAEFDGDYDRFWCSGGCAYFNRNYDASTTTGPWEMEIEYLPDHLKMHAQELIDIFNDNVTHGCCGGCR